MSEAFVGRQPIYDRELRIQAFELLFRNSPENQARFPDGDTATSEVIQSAFIDLGLDRLVGNRLAFINLTRDFLTGEIALALPPERVVLEIIEDIPVDAELVAAVDRLTRAGFRIALDDYVFDEAHAPLLRLASIVKLDVLHWDRTQLSNLVRRLRTYHVQLLAEKVETPEQLQFCRDLGFDYFQGYFLSRPNVVRGRRLMANQLVVMQLMARIHQPDLDPRELEHLIASDVSLSYQLLRFINSPFFGLVRPVESIHRAVVYLGIKAIRKWISLIALRRLEDIPPQAMPTALIRARTCQTLARDAGLGRLDSFFTVGLFSILDQLIQLPMAQALQDLPLSQEVKQALLLHVGPMGEALDCARAFETDDPQRPRTFMGLSEETTSRLYLEAVAWAYDLEREMAP
ncbi:MAG: EAL and HDOD domain-containing protein [Ectothiorhodospira sp.]